MLIVQIHEVMLVSSYCKHDISAISCIGLMLIIQFAMATLNERDSRFLTILF